MPHFWIICNSLVKKFENYSKSTTAKPLGISLPQLIPEARILPICLYKSLAKPNSTHRRCLIHCIERGRPPLKQPEQHKQSIIQVANDAAAATSRSCRRWMRRNRVAENTKNKWQRVGRDAWFVELLMRRRRH